jgi:hypothetical protein
MIARRAPATLRVVPTARDGVAWCAAATAGRSGGSPTTLLAPMRAETYGRVGTSIPDRVTGSPTMAISRAAERDARTYVR